MNIIPTFEALYEEDAEHLGTFAISMVDRPAIKELAVQLSEEVSVAMAEEKKKQLLGCILVPDVPIRRKDDKFGEYNIFFSAETIEKVSHDYMKNHRQDNVTLQHREPMQGVTLVETWLVEDSNKDKSSNYGMNLKKGSWVGLFQLSDEAWDNHVENGEVKGFSIEGLFAFERRATPEETIAQVKHLLSQIEDE